MQVFSAFREWRLLNSCTRNMWVVAVVVVVCSQAFSALQKEALWRTTALWSWRCKAFERANFDLCVIWFNCWFAWSCLPHIWKLQFSDPASFWVLLLAWGCMTRGRTEVYWTLLACLHPRNDSLQTVIQILLPAQRFHFRLPECTQINVYIYTYEKKYIDCLWNLLLFQEHQWGVSGLVHRNKLLTWPRFVVTYSQLGGCYICYIPAIQRCLLHNCSRSKTSRSHGLSMSGYEFETFWSPWASLGHVKTIALHQKTTGFLQVLVTLYMWRFNFLHILYAMNHSTARAQSIPNLCYWFSIRFLHFVRYWYHHFEVLRTSALRPCSTWRQLRCNSWKTSTLRPGEGLNRWMTEWRWISIWKRRQCTLIILRPI